MAKSKIKNLVFIALLASLIFSFALADLARAIVMIPSLHIYSDTSWTLEHSPYIFALEEIFIHAGATLTIAAGVTVKLANTIYLDGQLRAEGELGQPVIFTSSFADQPAAGDWGPIIVRHGGSLSLNYSLVELGGMFEQGAVRLEQGEVNIANSVIEHNYIGIEVTDSGTVNQAVNITNANIVNNDLAGIINHGNSEVQAINNWWGHNSGPWHENLNPAGQGEKIIGQVNFTPWLQEQEKPDPVIIIPGIMGSWQLGGQWELDPILHTYDNLWQALKLAGYIENQTLFALPYQWRLSNSYTALLLKDKIQAVKEICDCDKVDLIAHSMGGLAARAYAQSPDYQQDLDQLIFLAVPHQGATKAYLTWEGGEFGPTIKDKLSKRIFTLEAEGNGYGSVFQYIQGLPMLSVQELLPVYDYLRDKDSLVLRSYPDNYPANLFLEQLNSPAQLAKLNSVSVTNIIADAGPDSTINNLRVVDSESAYGEWRHGYPEHYSLPFTDHGLEYGLGDITVPQRSNQGWAGWQEEVIASSHNDIVTDAQKIIIKTLTGAEPVEEVRLSLFKKLLLVRIFSPADFLIMAPDNKLLGRDFISGQPINQIPGAFYAGFDGPAEFAVMPDPAPGDYQVLVQGRAPGAYQLAVDLISDDQFPQEDNLISGVISPGQAESFAFSLDQQDSTPVLNKAIDIDGLIKDLDELQDSQEINKQAVYLVLRLHYGLLSKIYDKMITANSQKKRQKLKQQLLLHLNINKIALAIYLKKQRLSQLAYEILSNDIEQLINNFKIYE